MRSMIFSLISTFILCSCTSPGKKTGVGAGVGAATGALVGAVIGHQSGKRKEGALVGAAVGALAGGGVGNYLDKQAKELEQVAETRRTEHGIVTKLKGDILFDSGAAALKPQARQNIAKIGDILKKYPEDRITVVGHTDSTGKASTNQQLSENRAKAVMVELVNRGVDRNSISVVGMGSSQPVADNKTAQGRSMNRRVELQITVPQPQEARN